MLDTGDASPLAIMPGQRSREIALVAIANYAKFTGQYDKFQQLKKRYNLKWNQNDSTQYFERFFNSNLSLESMIDRIKGMIRVLPAHMGAVVRFAVLTGLRCTEACESVRLLNPPFLEFEKSYYNPETETLEHFRHPAIFLRTTKKAYISYITKEQLSGIGILGGKTPTLNAINLACRRRKIKMEMYLCRRIFASQLRQSGIQSEFVNLLQGRVASDILTQHYLAPSDSLKQQVLLAISNLERKLLN